MQLHHLRVDSFFARSRQSLNHNCQEAETEAAGSLCARGKADLHRMFLVSQGYIDLIGKRGEKEKEKRRWWSVSAF